jgi:hypothetical protein
MKVFININTMYDKYFLGNTFTTGSGAQLPKHKGIFITSGVCAGSTFYIVNSQGNTFAMNVIFPAGSNVFPMQVYSVLSLAAGQTGMYVN